jgi:hypothetical protein
MPYFLNISGHTAYGPHHGDEISVDAKNKPGHLFPDRLNALTFIMSLGN